MRSTVPLYVVRLCNGCLIDNLTDRSFWYSGSLISGTLGTIIQDDAVRIGNILLSRVIKESEGIVNQEKAVFLCRINGSDELDNLSGEIEGDPVTNYIGVGPEMKLFQNPGAIGTYCFGA